MAASTAPKHKQRAPGRPFQKGQSGNPAGRQQGSRNKIAESFFDAVYADFQEHGVDAVQKAREESPINYVKMIAGLLPQQVEVRRIATDMSDAELDAAIADAVRRANIAAGEAAPSASQIEPGGVLH